MDMVEAIAEEQAKELLHEENSYLRRDPHLRATQHES